MLDVSGYGKVALITGASRGIGRGFALAMAKDGYDIAFTYSTRAEEAAEVEQQIAAMGRKCLCMQANLVEQEAPERVVRQTAETLGRIDVLVNNAVIHSRELINTVPDEKMNNSIFCNLRAPLLLSKYASIHMIEKGIKGNIVFIVSTRGERAYPNDFIYGGMKAGLIRCSQSLALSLSKYGIRVNCLAPGYTYTQGVPGGEYNKLGDKIPIGRGGTPQDMANYLLFLVSDNASYITGTNLRIDGGLILAGMPEDTSPEAGYGWGEVRDYSKSR